MKEIKDQIEIVSAPAGRGAAWLTEALPFFASTWENWLGMGLVFFALSIASAIIPLGSLALNIFLPALIAGMMRACQKQEQGGEITIAHLFSGFSSNLGQQVILGIIYSISLFVIAIIMVILIIIMMAGLGILTEIINTLAGLGTLTEIMNSGLDAISDNILEITIVLLIAVLAGLLLYLPLVMAFWFSPVLIELENQSAVVAMKNSFFACAKNVVPYFLYCIVGLVFTLLATLPIALGWLVLFPVFIISIYLSYKDIFKKIPTVEVMNV